MQKGFALSYSIIGLIILSLIGGAYYLGTKGNLSFNNNTQKACTEEAKICPDGSSVGRTGVNCEFSPCPPGISSASAETADWKTYDNSEYNFSFLYPPIWVIRTLQSPFSIELSPINNKEAPVSAMSISLRNEPFDLVIENQKLINGEKITVGGVSGVKGSYYSSPSGWTGRIIVLPYKNKTLFIREQKEFEKDIDQILSTFKFLDQ